MTVIWHGKDITNELVKVADAAVSNCAYNLALKSMSVAPLDTGAMVRSCEVKKEGNLEWIVRYDPAKLSANSGVDYYYAMRQHEDMNLSHPNGKQAKFLTGPYTQNQKKYFEYIKDKIKEVFK